MSELYQIWGGISVLPALTQYQLQYIKDEIISTFTPIGNIVDDFYLYKGLIRISNIPILEDYLWVSCGKQTEIYDVRDRQGVRYGFSMVIDEQGNKSTIPILGIVPYNTFPDKIALYMQPKIVDIEGQQTMYTPSNNTILGYASYDQRID